MTEIPRGARLDVAVVGAGAAGLAAAGELHRAGLAVAVYEARDRLGGRIFTHRDPRVPVPIELGAEFLHGEAPQTSRLLREAESAVLDVKGELWQAGGGRLRPFEDFWRRIDRVLGRIEPETPDRSLAEWLAKRPGGRALARDRTLARRFVESFHAADPEQVSVLSLAGEGGAPTESARRVARAAGGYDRVAHWLARDLAGRIHLRSPVTEIAWERGGVELEVRPEGEPAARVRARSVVVTVPVGVLGQPAGEPGSLGFRPALPPRVRRALDLLAMGTVTRVVLAFRELPWEGGLAGLPAGRDLARLGFLHTSDPAVAVWWTAYPVRAPLLVAWSGGPPAAELVRRGTGALVDHTVGALAGQLGLPRRRVSSRLLDVWTHDWDGDPSSRGAYSYVRVGGSEAARTLSRPLESTVFLAGEATDTGGQTGTVEGAIASGLRAARQVRAALR